MNIGYQLYLQKDMTEADKRVCQDYLNNFIQRTENDPKHRYGGTRSGGYTSFYRRGIYGQEIGFYPQYKNTTKLIVFRRISKNSRKFACVYVDTLIVKDDRYIDKAHPAYRELVPNGTIPNNMCLCQRHKGSIRVDWKNKPDFELYYESGSYRK